MAKVISIRPFIVVTIEHRSDPVSTYYLHVGSYYHLEKGGLSPWMTFHAALPHIPLGIKDPFFKTRFRIAEPLFPVALLSRLSELGPYFDYILLRNTEPRISAQLESVLEPVFQAGPYEAYSFPRR